mmetsp:Transcript_7166/g.11819  ORF Transcript_7166/g.11819 Transcript_7166/m.11819 type:complete len:266 (+) Transcript_7166:794-1591(+)
MIARIRTCSSCPSEPEAEAEAAAPLFFAGVLLFDVAEDEAFFFLLDLAATGDTDADLPLSLSLVVVVVVTVFSVFTVVIFVGVFFFFFAGVDDSFSSSSSSTTCTSVFTTAGEEDRESFFFGDLVPLVSTLTSTSGCSFADPDFGVAFLAFSELFNFGVCTGGVCGVDGTDLFLFFGVAIVISSSFCSSSSFSSFIFGCCCFPVVADLDFSPPTETLFFICTSDGSLAFEMDFLLVVEATPSVVAVLVLPLDFLFLALEGSGTTS